MHERTKNNLLLGFTLRHNNLYLFGHNILCEHCNCVWLNWISHLLCTQPTKELDFCYAIQFSSGLHLQRSPKQMHASFSEAKVKKNLFIIIIRLPFEICLYFSFYLATAGYLSSMCATIKDVAPDRKN